MYKSRSEIVGETHVRTVVKAACYRIMSILITIALTFVLGGTIAQAVAMGTVSLIVGSLHYYFYDRLWLLIKWDRNPQGLDTVRRSVTKAVLYRITAIISMMILARMVFADTTIIAFLMATLKTVCNAVGYFVIERIFNKIGWGKKG